VDFGEHRSHVPADLHAGSHLGDEPVVFLISRTVAMGGRIDGGHRETALGCSYRPGGALPEATGGHASIASAGHIGVTPHPNASLIRARLHRAAGFGGEPMVSQYTSDRLAEAAASSCTMSEALIKLGVDPKSSARRYIRERMKKLGIDISHFEREGIRWTREVLASAVAVSTNMNDVLRNLGIE
jgi:hypothetical protein